ncbi:hypothetical protein LTR08_009043 [Meristemomyces frigidus]|nr:hypothetical protein LTR08_009043 [Meristemomyces frigidus]
MSGALYRNDTTSDACWQQWEQYWSLSTFAANPPDSAMYETVLYTLYSYVTSDSFYTTTDTWKNILFDSNVIPTTTVIITTTDPSDYIEYTLSATAETTGTTSVVTLLLDVPPSPMPITPACSLPSSVPQCQAQWNSWASVQWATRETSPGGEFHMDANPPPACSQASLSGTLCSQLAETYLASAYMYGQSDGGEYGMQETDIGTYPHDTYSYFWPTSSMFAPGCTLGCQACRITGGTVQLLFWPPSTANRARPVTSVGLGTTFTSPTIYISFDSLYASDSCSKIGTTFVNTIIPIINTADLRSLWGFSYFNGLMATASFNMTDLFATHVPDDIYNSQPRCALWSIYNGCATSPGPHGAGVTNVPHLSETVPADSMVPVEAFTLTRVVSLEDGPVTAGESLVAPSDQVINTGSGGQVFEITDSSGSIISTGTETVEAGSVPMSTATDVFTASIMSDGAILVAGISTTTTITPETGYVTLDGQQISLSVVGAMIGISQTESTTLNVANPASPVFTIGGKAYTEQPQDGEALAFGDASTTFTILVGGAGSTIGGQSISAAANGELLWADPLPRSGPDRCLWHLLV